MMFFDVKILIKLVDFREYYNIKKQAVHDRKQNPLKQNPDKMENMAFGISLSMRIIFGFL